MEKEVFQMEVHERIKELRKDFLHLSQTEFGEKLGVSRSVINNIERNVLARPDQKLSLMKLICNTFNVNEDWLLNGTGDMFAQPTTFCLDDFAAERGATSLELELIKAYFELDPEIREAVINHFKKRLSPDPAKAKIDKEVAAYRADLELEARQESSASGTPDAKEA